MGYEYSEKRIYNQLLYLAGLFDVDKAKAQVMSTKELEGVKERVIVLAEGNRSGFGVLKEVVEGYLKKCGRQWVDMGGLFGFAMR